MNNDDMYPVDGREKKGPFLSFSAKNFSTHPYIHTYMHACILKNPVPQMLLLLLFP